MRVVALILARLTSTRLPGKALCDIAGQPLIHYVIQRARGIRNVADLVFATSNRTLDDRLAEYAKSMGVRVFRGSHHNVAARCIECSREMNADFFVRINGDSPCVDPLLIQQAVDMVTLHASIDLATNLLARTFPYGIAVEVVRKSSLQQVLPDLNISDAEHVTRYFYKNAPQFRIHQMLSDAPELAQARLTIDTAEDLERFRQLARHLGRRVEEASYKEIATAYLDLFQDGCEQHSASLG